MAKQSQEQLYKQYQKQMTSDARDIQRLLQKHARRFKKGNSNRGMVKDLESVRTLLRQVAASMEVFTL